MKYYYREIYLEKEKNGIYGVFPNGRKPRWNWTGTVNANGTVTGAASNKDPSYIVDPEKLIQDIEDKGDSIYTNSSEYDYEFVMTRKIISQIRKYNKQTKNGRKVNYLDFSLAGVSSDKRNFSEVIRDWYSEQTLYRDALNITECNNALGNTCVNYK